MKEFFKVGNFFQSSMPQSINSQFEILKKSKLFCLHFDRIMHFYKKKNLDTLDIIDF